MVPAFVSTLSLAGLIVVSAVVVAAEFFPETIDNGLNSKEIPFLSNSHIFMSN